MRSQTTAWLLCLALGACSTESSPPECTDCGGDSGATTDADAAIDADSDVSADAGDSQVADEPDATDDGGDEQAVVDCVPETDHELCARQNKTCGKFSSNDNCGNWRDIDDCGFGVVCEAPLVCGWCNRCCLKETDAEFCARNGATCGSVSAPDNCGGWRNLASCGTCAAPEVCGPSSVCCAAEADGGLSCPLPPSDGGADGD
jgi:hypothetical protein